MLPVVHTGVQSWVFPTSMTQPAQYLGLASVRAYVYLCWSLMQGLGVMPACCCCVP